MTAMLTGAVQVTMGELAMLPIVSVKYELTEFLWQLFLLRPPTTPPVGLVWCWCSVLLAACPALPTNALHREHQEDKNIFFVRVLVCIYKNKCLLTKVKMLAVSIV